MTEETPKETTKGPKGQTERTGDPPQQTRNTGRPVRGQRGPRGRAAQGPKKPKPVTCSARLDFADGAMKMLRFSAPVDVTEERLLALCLKDLTQQQAESVVQVQIAQSARQGASIAVLETCPKGTYYFNTLIPEDGPQPSSGLKVKRSAAEQPIDPSQELSTDEDDSDYEDVRRPRGKMTADDDVEYDPDEFGPPVPGEFARLHAGAFQHRAY